MQVLVHTQSPDRDAHAAVILVHGLEGSSEAGYLVSAANAALKAGCVVHRTNIRGCGGTEGLCNTLYHAGLTSDLRALAQRIHQESGLPIYLIGYSLGGNQVLKLAGELGESAQGWLAGAIAVSTPLDLRACALKLCQPSNRLYQERFVRNMGARMRRRHQVNPKLFSIDAIPHIRTVYDFDDKVTAPFFGFGNADNYYRTQSCGGFLQSIAVPTLLIHAEDDPMIPFEVYQNAAFASNPNLKLLTVDHGGHVGFLAKGPNRFWVDHVIQQWIVSNR